MKAGRKAEGIRRFTKTPVRNFVGANHHSPNPLEYYSSTDEPSPAFGRNQIVSRRDAEAQRPRGRLSFNPLRPCVSACDIIRVCVQGLAPTPRDHLEILFSCCGLVTQMEACRMGFSPCGHDSNTSASEIRKSSKMGTDPPISNRETREIRERRTGRHPYTRASVSGASGVSITAIRCNPGTPYLFRS